jgi:ribosomal protein S18 acetylase RimI-like enzyme
MTIAVRPAQPADFADIARLTVAAYAADGQLDGEHGYERVLADVASRAQDAEVLVAVDPDTGEVLGAVTFVLPGSRYAELSRTSEAEFRMLAVDPAAQRRGVGRALVQACLDRAGTRGCTAVVISARDLAAAAHQLYAGFGFERVPENDWSPLPGVRLLALRLALPASGLVALDQVERHP